MVQIPQPNGDRDGDGDGDGADDGAEEMESIFSTTRSGTWYCSLIL